WESDQGDPRPIGIVGRVDLVVLQGGHREQDMGALPRECSSLEVDSSCVSTLGILLKHVLLDGVVLERLDLLQLSTATRLGHLQLGTNKLVVLLDQELSRQVARPVLPVLVLVDDVEDGGRLPVLALAISDLTGDGRAERVVRIVGVDLDRLEDGCLLVAIDWNVPVLVREELNIHTIRKIVGVDCHSLHVVLRPNLDTNLSVVVVAHGEILDTGSNLDEAISLGAAFVSIDDLNTVLGQRLRFDHTEWVSVGDNVVVAREGLDLFSILERLAPSRPWLGENNGGPIVSGDAGAFLDDVLFVAFHLKGSDKLVFLSGRQSKRFLNALTDVDKLLLFDLLTQGSQRVLEPLLLGKVIRRQELSDTRLLVRAPTKLFGDLLVGVALLSKSHGLGVVKIGLVVAANGSHVTELGR